MHVCAVESIHVNADVQICMYIYVSLHEDLVFV